MRFDSVDDARFRSTSRHPAAAALPFASCRSSASGAANFAVPQSKQTTILGKTHTGGLSMPFSTGKWMAISALNSRWLPDPHDSQDLEGIMSTLRCSIVVIIVSVHTLTRLFQGSRPPYAQRPGAPAAGETGRDSLFALEQRQLRFVVGKVVL